MIVPVPIFLIAHSGGDREAEYEQPARNLRESSDKYKEIHVVSFHDVVLAQRRSCVVKI